MRIAFLTMGRDIGGTAQDVITLTQGLSERGHSVYVISSKGVMNRELQDTKVTVIEAPLYTRNPIGLWRASRKIRRIVFERQIEILNPQGMYTALSSWLATLGFERNRFRVITTIHMFSQLNLYKYAWSLNLFSKWIVTESNCERNRLAGGGAYRERITVISNSVDMQRFSRENRLPVLRSEYSVPEDHCCFGIIARLSKEKRHLDFIKAAKKVHAINGKTTFFIVGDGPEKERITASVNGSDAFIKLTGLRRDIPDVLHSLDCFVLCSEVESLPLSIREAMSMGLPVIASDVGGIREAVLHGITGLVIPPLHPDALAESMLLLSRERKTRDKFGNNGYELCKLNFELNSWVRKTEDLFHKIIIS